MKTAQTKLSRRSFLFAATAATAATATAIVATKKAASSGKRTEGTQSKKGYQLTEHVSNYYRTAKI